MKQYHDLVARVLTEGVRKPNRTGVDTVAVWHHAMSFDMGDGFPLMTSKKISWKNIVVELLWFLSGRTDIGFLKKHNCKFWDPWADRNGHVPSAYGHYWREFPVPHRMSYGTWKHDSRDQIEWVIDLLKKNPTTRRGVVSAWAPSNAHTSKLPPCHCMFVLNAFPHDAGTFKLNMHMTQRSADIALGVPYNIASYALLLHLISRFTAMTPGTFVHTLCDAHIYTKKSDGSMEEYDHTPGLRKQIARTYAPLPQIEISSEIQTLEDLDRLMELDTEELLSHFKLIDYNPKPAISFKVAV